MPAMAVEYSGYAGPFYCFFFGSTGGARLPKDPAFIPGIKVPSTEESDIRPMAVLSRWSVV